MTIAVVHNYYQYRGGEDTVFEAESRLLSERGHRVIPYSVHNDAVNGYSKFALARATVWNSTVYDDIVQIFRREKPDIVHVHNTLPLLSPAVYGAARDAVQGGIPVVQTLHNYRLLCANALFFREGRVCEDCLGTMVGLPAVRHACYRDSRSASAVVAGMTALHRVLGTWQHCVTTYITLTEFARQKYIQGGLPVEKLVVKPNFAEQDAGTGTGAGAYALYVGRLSEEKGAMLLLEAWRTLTHSTNGADIAFPLVVIGDGPLRQTMEDFCQHHALHTVELRGAQPLQDVMEAMKAARCLVFPSVLYETFGKSMVEAFSCGTPVVCSRLGAMQEIVEHGVTGLHFTPYDAADIAAQICHLWAMPNNDYEAMRHAARRRFEERYTADANMRLLEHIYEITQTRHHQ